MNSDENLCKKLLKLNINLSDTLNIYFTYKKVKNGCYIDIKKNLSNKFENILLEYKLKYKKYNSDQYFISKKLDPTNIIFIDENNNFNDKIIGKFLGYECVYDLNKDKPCKKGYLLNVNYINNNSIQTQVYGFCCLQTDLKLNIINNTLEIIHKMNYYMKKYLSKFLKGGNFALEISKLSDYTSHK